MESVGAIGSQIRAIVQLKSSKWGLFGASKGSANVSRGFRGATGGCMGLMKVGCCYLTCYIV